MEIEDQLNGRWFVDIPYNLRKNGDTLVRTYFEGDVPENIRKSIKSCGDPLVTKMIKFTRELGIQRYTNGRENISIDPPPGIKVNKVYPVCSPPMLISEYSHIKKTYDISYLICARLKGIIDWQNKAQQCTPIGSNIARSLIRVAATRIFADPTQSIMEIIANSVDAYRSMHNLPKIGRFGMGFFSFLYFLIGHPKRKLTITSYVREGDCYYTYFLVISEIDGSLGFSLQYIPSQSPITGVRTVLDMRNDPIPQITTFLFDKYIRRMNNIRSPEIIVSSLFPLNRDSIGVSCSSYMITVEDFATGMPADVIINTLLTPSVSTKGIHQVRAPNKYVNESKVEVGTKIASRLQIMVDDVILVDLPDMDIIPGYRMIITMPREVGIPIARNDIILKGFENEFAESLDICMLGFLEKNGRFDILENLLHTYAGYTSSNDMISFIHNWIDEQYNKLDDRLVVNEKDITLYKLITGEGVICATKVDPFKIDRFLDSKGYNIDTSVFHNKKVLYVSEGYKAIESGNGGSVSYMFITPSVYNQKDWKTNFIASYSKEFLIPVPRPPVISSDKPFEYFEPHAIKAVGDKVWRDTELHLSDIYYNIINILTNIAVKKGTNDSRDIFVAFLRSIELCKPLGAEFITEVIRKISVISSSFEGVTGYGKRKRSIGTVYHKYWNAPNMNSPFKIRLYKEFVNLQIAMIKRSCTDTTSPILLTFNNTAYLNIETDYTDGMFDDTDITLYEYVLFNRAVGASTDPSAVLDKVWNVYDRVTKPSKGSNAAAILLKVRDVYRRTIKPVENPYLVYEINWSLMKYIQMALSELRTWINDITKYKIPKIPSHLPIHNPITFTAKQMINYAFKYDKIDDLKAVSGMDKTLDLQIIEIAVNAGTTKPFIEAVLSELFQNSRDAITNASIPGRIDIEIGESSTVTNGFVCKFSDNVGMSFDNIVAMMIPFYSDKSKSNVAAGEMGTGFFNIYRQSSSVYIETCLNGALFRILSNPIRNREGVVTDINHRIEKKYKPNLPNGTSITFQVSNDTREDFIEVYGGASYFINDVIILSGITIYINGKESNVTRELVWDDPVGLKCYRVDRKAISYVFVQGVPFMPLTVYRPLHDYVMNMAIGNGVVIDIDKKFATPVQNRTSIVLNDELVFRKFLISSYYKLIAQKMLILVHVPVSSLSPEEPYFLEKFRNLEYDGDIAQVLPDSRYTLYPGNVEEYIFNYKVSGVASLSMTLIKIYNDARKNNVDLKTSWKKLSDKSKAKYPNDLNLRIMYALAEIWIKNKKLVPSKKPQTGNILLKDNVHLAYMWKVSRIFIDTFIEYAGNDFKYPSPIGLEFEPIKDDEGWYTNGVITLCWREKEEDLIEAFHKTIQTGNIIAIKQDFLFGRIFSCTSLPCALMIHELEHARRKTNESKDLGVHSPIDIEYRGTSKNYSFDHGANFVASMIANNGSFGKWLERIKDITL